MDKVYIFLLLIIIVGFSSAYYLSVLKSLGRLNIKIDVAKRKTKEALNIKLNLLIKVGNTIKNKLKIEDDKLDEIENLEKLNISDIELDRKLNDTLRVTTQIKSDYPKLEKNKSLKEIQTELKSNDEKLEAAKIYYNQYSEKLNQKIKKFPVNIIAKTKKIKNNKLFDTKKTNKEAIDIKNL